VIRSFRDKRAEALHRGDVVPEFQNVRAVVLRKLDMLDAAARLSDLRAPPDNRLEALAGDREGQHSIRINDRLRICFVWKDDGRSRSRSSITIEENAMPRIRTHPGEILREEFMKPLGLSANALALALRVPATRIGDILRRDKPRAISADTAIRLGRYFGTTAEFWLNLQSAYDLSLALAENGPTIERDVHPRAEIAV
jgi:antitoxin HigA-1